MRRKRIILVSIIAIILLIMAIIGYIAFSKNLEKTQKGVFEEEISKINLNEEIDMNVKAKGSYGKIEKQIKEDMKEYYDLTKVILNNYVNPELSKTFTIDNYKTDGPEFIKTKQSIENLKKELKETQEKLEKILKQETIDKKAKSLGVNKELQQEYKEKLAALEYSPEGLEQIQMSNQKRITYLEKVEEILNYLSTNKGQWEIKDNKIQYKTESIGNRYEEMLMELTKLK
ncbi:MAG: hypothetical protein ACLVAK_08495 [Clostridia bacterium]